LQEDPLLHVQVPEETHTYQPPLALHLCNLDMLSPQKHILTRTGNCMAVGAGLSKESLLNSNVELLNSLRENYKGAIDVSLGSKAAEEGNTEKAVIKLENWTAVD